MIKMALFFLFLAMTIKIPMTKSTIISARKIAKRYKKIKTKKKKLIVSLEEFSKLINQEKDFIFN